MATYYVSNTGSNSNSGLSTGQAWQTLAKVASTATQGDTINLERGGIWRETIVIPGSDMIFRDYGDALAAPIVSGGTLVTSWSLYSGNIYQAALTTQPWFVTSTLSNATQVLTKATSLAALVQGQWWWVANILYVNDGNGNPAISGAAIDAAVLFQMLQATGRSNLQFINLAIRHATQRGIHIINQTGAMLFQNIDGRYCGMQVASGGPIAIYLTAGTANGGGRITGCTLADNDNDSIFILAVSGYEIDHNSFPSITGASADHIQCEPVTINGQTIYANDIRVHHNTFAIAAGSNTTKGHFLHNGGSGSYCGWNTFVGGNYGYGAGASNSVCEYNTFLDINKDITFAAAMYMGTLVNSDSQIFRYNTADNCAHGILATANGGWSRTNLGIIHNTITRPTRQAASFRGPVSGVFKCNILDTTGSSPDQRTYQVDTVASGGTWDSDYNIIRPDRTGMIIHTGTTYNTLAAYATGKSQDTHSSTSDPLLTSIPTDMTLQAGSPARAAGVAVANVGQVGTVYDLGAKTYNRRFADTSRASATGRVSR